MDIVIPKLKSKQITMSFKLAQIIVKDDYQVHVETVGLFTSEKTACLAVFDKLVETEKLSFDDTYEDEDAEEDEEDEKEEDEKEEEEEEDEDAIKERVRAGVDGIESLAKICEKYSEAMYCKRKDSFKFSTIGWIFEIKDLEVIYDTNTHVLK